MDPRIRIRIYPKMSWIRNPDPKYLRGVAGGVVLVEKRRHITESPEQLVSFGTATTILSESQLIPPKGADPHPLFLYAREGR
jgi:hypothetical protein